MALSNLLRSQLLPLRAVNLRHDLPGAVALEYRPREWTVGPILLAPGEYNQAWSPAASVREAAMR